MNEKIKTTKKEWVGLIIYVFGALSLYGTINNILNPFLFKYRFIITLVEVVIILIGFTITFKEIHIREINKVRNKYLRQIDIMLDYIVYSIDKKED